MKIKQVQIKYFRSIYNQVIDLGNLSIVAGMNDAGKSNLLKALNLFFNNQTGWKENFSFGKDFNLQRLQEFEASKRLKDAKEIFIKITFEDVNEATPIWEKRWRSDGTVIEAIYDQNLSKSERSATGFKMRSRVPTMLRKIRYLYVPALKGPEYISHLIGQLSNILSEKASRNIRQAATGFEAQLATYLSDITDDIKVALSIDSLLKLPTDLIHIFENMEFSDVNGIGLTHRGDGIRTRHIPILLNKISSLHADFREKGELYDHFIWGYEEPENNVELTACFLLAEDFSQRYSKLHQIIISTHSPAFYGVPERFLPDWKQGVNSVYRYAAEKRDGKTLYIPANQDDLDPLFLLPAITPYVEKEQQKVALLQKEVETLSAKGAFFSVPTVFVEGPCDRTVFEKALSIFFPDLVGKLKFEAPSSSQEGGGGEYVKDHLIMWESKQKHIEPAKRTKAIGFFDCDDAGNSALKKYKAFVQNPETAYGVSYQYKLEKEDHFYKLQKSTLAAKIPYVLEYLYSSELWKEAEQKKWLEEKDNTIEFLPADIVSMLANSNKSIQDLCEDTDLSRYIKFRVKEDKKLKLAKFIANANNDDAKVYLYFFERILDKGLKKMSLM